MNSMRRKNQAVCEAGTPVALRILGLALLAWLGLQPSWPICAAAGQPQSPVADRARLSRSADALTSDLSPLFDPQRMMRVADVRPGMKGYGLTVFRGIRPERFEAEVVGVRRGAFSGQDIIICRFSHPELRDIGVVAGMSGSPVFIDGKLVGAVAYGWMLMKEALGGVTPIEDMLRVMDATRDDLRDPDDLAGGNELFERFSALRASMNLPTPRNREPSHVVRISKSDLDLTPDAAASLPETIALEPLAAPLFTSARCPRSLELLRSVFPGSPLYSTAGGVSAPIGSPNASDDSRETTTPDLTTLSHELAGGYALAVPMVEGDISLAGVGTVTYRDGNRLVAFGHPMFCHGIVAYPMAPARIFGVVRSILRPFKLGESLGQVGSIRQDRLPAVGGVFGSFAQMFPIRVSIEDAEYTGRRQFSCRVWNDRRYSPALTSMVLAESIVAASQESGEAAVDFQYSVALDDGTTMTKRDYVVDALYGGFTAALMVGSELGMLTTNPYKRVKLADVEFFARISERYPVASVLSAWTDKLVYRPGENVRVYWELQPYRQPVLQQSAEISLSPELPDGDYQLMVGDADARMTVEATRNPAALQIRDYESLVRVLRRSFPKNHLYLTFEDKGSGSAIRGQELPRLPSSVITTLEQSTAPPHYETIAGNILVERGIPTRYEITGMQQLVVKVRRTGRE